MEFYVLFNNQGHAGIGCQHCHLWDSSHTEVLEARAATNITCCCRYEILQCGDVEKLIKKWESPTVPPNYFVPSDDTFDILKCAHIATEHSGHDRVIKELSKKYMNITSDCIVLFKSLCNECQRKHKLPTTKSVVVRPILNKEFSSHGQVDLVDMQAMSQGLYASGLWCTKIISPNFVC